MSDKNLEISILLDYYEGMLTEKQRDLLDLYFNKDLSLGEISELEGITRQGVRDAIKRGENALLELEEKLNLHKKMAEVDEVMTQISEIARMAGNYMCSSEVAEYLEKIKELADGYISEL